MIPPPAPACLWQATNNLMSKATLPPNTVMLFVTAAQWELLQGRREAQVVG